MGTSQLVKDVSTIAGVVGNIGLSIANAQKLFNIDYLEAVERLAKVLQGVPAKSEGDEDRNQAIDAFVNAIKAIAPPRYQYTETELEFRADLSQSKQRAYEAGLSGSIKAVTLKASIAGTFGQEYNAAAKIRTTIHALSDQTDLIGQIPAREQRVDLPQNSVEMNDKLLEAAVNLGKSLKVLPDGNPAAG